MRRQAKKAKKQPKLNLYGKGIYKTKAGHLRYSSPKELRNEYVHRKVVKDRLDETPYSIRLLLPWPYEVHHLDFNKEHNESYNLCMVDIRLHSAMTADRARDEQGRLMHRGAFEPKWKAPPDWKLFDDNFEEVPF